MHPVVRVPWMVQSQSYVPALSVTFHAGPPAGTELDVVVWAKPFALFQVRVVSTATVLVAGANGVVRRQIWVADDVRAQAEPTPLGVMECQ